MGMAPEVDFPIFQRAASEPAFPTVVQGGASKPASWREQITLDTLLGAWIRSIAIPVTTT